MDPNNLGDFYIIQLVWYIFATIVSFIAALLFWNKGTAVVSGREFTTTRIVLKLSGATAIFIAIMFIFRWFNPVISPRDSGRWIIVQSDRSVDDMDIQKLSNVSIEIYKDEDFWKGLNYDDLAIQLIPDDYIFRPLPTTDGKIIICEKIPRGTYLLTVFKKDHAGFTLKAFEVE